MPVLWIPEAEWKALHALFAGHDEIDWDAYERARQFVVRPEPVPVEAAMRIIAKALETEAKSG